VLGFLRISESIVVLAWVIRICVVGFDSFLMLFSQAGQPTSATLVFWILRRRRQVEDEVDQCSFALLIFLA
jgi:hypothetical protein